MPSRHLNVTYLRTLSDGKPGLIKELLTMFRKESSAFLLASEINIKEKQYTQLAKAAHGMKPSGTYLGADLLTALMTSLEGAAATGDEQTLTEVFDQAKILIADLIDEIDLYLSKN